MIGLIITLILLMAMPVLAEYGDRVILEKRYPGFTVWIDCEAHGTSAFYYTLGRDTGNISRKHGKFIPDPTVPSQCQPTSARSYRTPTVPSEAGTYDRGHLVPANHMDGSVEALSATFYLTNILPQHSAFNQSRGAWHQTEVITECYRDIARLHIWGGVLWGSNEADDYFVQSHGVTTPDYWWKVIYREDRGEYLAWIFPNTPQASAQNIDDYLISLDQLFQYMSYIPDFKGLQRSPIARQKPVHSWDVKKSGSTLQCEGTRTSAG